MELVHCFHKKYGCWIGFDDAKKKGQFIINFVLLSEHIGPLSCLTLMNLEWCLAHS